MAGGERVSMPRADEQSLRQLIGKSTLLVERDGHVYVTDKLEIPCDEFGLPLREQFVKDVLATIVEPHVWTGSYDLHHLAWSRERFRRIGSKDHPSVGVEFRGAPQNKLRLNRQLHNYIHASTHELRMLDFGVMLQFTQETTRLVQLYDTICLRSYEDRSDIPEDEKEAKRLENFRAKLETVKQGWLGVMPDVDILKTLDATEARGALRGIARVKGLSNARKSKRTFFASTSDKIAT